MIESYANVISDINLIDIVINKLNQSYSDLNDKYAKSSRVDKEIKTEQKNLDKTKERKSRSEKWEKEIIEKLEQHRLLEDRLNKECKNYKELKPRLDEIEKLEREKGRMVERYDGKFNELKKFLNSSLYLLYLEEQLGWCSNELLRLKNEEEIPPTQL